MHKHNNDLFESTGAWENYNALHDHLRDQHGPWPVGLRLNGLVWQTLMSLHRLCAHTPNLLPDYEPLPGDCAALRNTETRKAIWTCDHRHTTSGDAVACAQEVLNEMDKSVRTLGEATRCSN